MYRRTVKRYGFKVLGYICCARVLPWIILCVVWCSDPERMSSTSMGWDDKIVKQPEEETRESWTLCLHSLSDLSHISPIVFLYLIKECYASGTLKATRKFGVLQHQVHQVLNNGPRPGPATFVIHCLYALPVFDIHCEGFSHLIISSLRRFLKANLADSLQAKDLAAHLFVDMVQGYVNHDERILLKVVEVFDVRLTNLENVICELKATNINFRPVTALTFLEQYIFKLIESQSYMTAVTMLEHFSIRQSGKSFLLAMMEKKEFRAAEKWATFMGKPMLCVLVQEYFDRKMLKYAYVTIKKNNLRQEFGDVYHQCKESSMKQLAEKGCWDVAESKAKGDKQLIEYLVYLAMEAGYSEKVDELCDRYSLQGFPKSKEFDATLLHRKHYLCLKELGVEDVFWVDRVDSLHTATCYIEESKVVGVDCEWKPNYVKGSKPNKVSIMQIASSRRVFIFDLIKLSGDMPHILDNCLSRILQSPSILKLGYNFQCDMKQLTSSYETLGCFNHFEMLLDIQNVFKESSGGLSGLAEEILGAGLNKTRRNSDWEQRPLSQNQLEYAALDAAVLVHIFHHIWDQSQQATADGNDKIEWKSSIILHMDNAKTTKKNVRNRTKCRVEID
ncbi:uncharacterized protein LOC115662825 isoform X2 [Syzygium oleosum]|uniref:uncharacterized protein LOC115662825 isoform X2 n=1 Tax=Syzygium oleosum TaxID=219896 RepID=UPI0024BA9EF7|nr:uncharacterized protein LOC115662825 isoform X2 [Syzygium oleosum]